MVYSQGCPTLNHWKAEFNLLLIFLDLSINIWQIYQSKYVPCSHQISDAHEQQCDIKY